MSVAASSRSNAARNASLFDEMVLSWLQSNPSVSNCERGTIVEKQLEGIRYNHKIGLMKDKSLEERCVAAEEYFRSGLDDLVPTVIAMAKSEDKSSFLADDVEFSSQVGSSPKQTFHGLDVVLGEMQTETDIFVVGEDGRDVEAWQNGENTVVCHQKFLNGFTVFDVCTFNDEGKVCRVERTVLRPL